MSAITCVTCRLQFGTFEDQKVHFQTEYHRENSKRNLQQLPPMTQREYLEYLQILKERKAIEDAKKRKVYRCILCDKQFSSENAFRQHCESAKHQAVLAAPKDEFQMNQYNQLTKGNTARVAQQDDDNLIVITEVEYEQKEKLPAFLSEDEHVLFKELLPKLEQLTEELQDKLITEEIFMKRKQMPAEQCLFCHLEFDTTDKQLEHMYQAHSFILPFKEYVANIPDLLQEMQKQVSVARSCLLCMRGFKSTEQCQKHMRNTGHTVFLPEEFAQQFIEFYDFSSSYPAEMLKLIQEENDPTLLKEIKSKRFYMTLDDFKYFVEGEQVGYLEWKEWKKAHVPEWLKILKLQNDMLRNLKLSLRGDFYEEQVKVGKPVDPTCTETKIKLKSEVQEIINKINDLGANCTSSEIIRINDSNMQKYLKVETYLSGKQIIEQLENKRAVYTTQNESINHDKPFFKRSTLHIYN
ncbi:Zinc_finger domain-containing protein [Hexamita inflata]|uniref:Zinc finger domain-containing protein n=1 Tax=Hexamita inflata TaxID=28002 RepID=A0AA86QCT6_9EUKA|nr:Zinc finger domain-containing protein [Hexamita inflata]CAI9963791.1 Zinc finger domain-containing protein [Hexamita inflata]